MQFNDLITCAYIKITPYKMHLIYIHVWSHPSWWIARGYYYMMWFDHFNEVEDRWTNTNVYDFRIFFLENMNLIITWTVINVHKNNKPLKSIGFDDIFVFFRKFFLFTKYLFVSRFCLLVLISKSQLLRHEFPPGWVQEQTINEHFTLEFFSVPQNPFVWFVCRQSLCQPNHTLFEKKKKQNSFEKH